MAISYREEQVLAKPIPAKQTSVLQARLWSRRNLAYIIAVGLILAIYSYPALRTTSVTGSRRLPSISAPDLGFYLSLSRMQGDREGNFQHPDYRIGVSSRSVGLLKFRLGPQLLGHLNDLLGGRLWIALFVWNLFWWGFLGVSAIWLLQKFLPQAPTELVLAGLSLLMLVNFGMLKPLVAGWMHFPAASGFETAQLPFMRPLFPQMAVPILLCYIGLQMYALRKTSIAAWAMMAALQWFAFASFPYATLLMAGTTAIAVLWYLFSHFAHTRWRIVLSYLLICLVSDSVFLLQGSAGIRTGSPSRSALIHFQPFLVPRIIGNLWVAIAVLVIAAAANSRLLPEVKWTLVGLGVSGLIFQLGDAVIPGTTLLLSEHIGYFFHSIIAILITFVVAAYVPSGPKTSRLLRVSSFCVVAFCFLSGALLAEGNYRFHLSRNLELADMAEWLARGEVSRNDLVISQYDACDWVPVLSDAEVLYCRNAECLLTHEQTRNLQRFREALYLYFLGKDHIWLGATSALERYGFYNELPVEAQTGENRTAAIRSELLPSLELVEKRDASVVDFFHRYRRIWVVQNGQEPIFDKAALGSYLEFREQQNFGALAVISAIPK